MPPEMKLFYSSHVQEAGYEAGELHVTWHNGATTVYGDAEHPVPADLAGEVLAAPSIGEALHLGVRGRFPHRTVRPA